MFRVFHQLKFDAQFIKELEEITKRSKKLVEDIYEVNEDLKQHTPGEETHAFLLEKIVDLMDQLNESPERLKKLVNCVDDGVVLIQDVAGDVKKLTKSKPPGPSRVKSDEIRRKSA